MYRRILVALDGSHTAGLGLKEAIRLGQALGAELCLVYVVDESTDSYLAGYGEYTEICAAMVKTGRQVLSEAQAEAAAAKVNAVTKLIELHTPGQRVSEVLVEEADAWSAELIVCGTHGRKGMSRIFLGSVAEGIIRVSTKPVLLIRAQPAPGTIP
jgi:nucleotide-binding universal stress UspA family protein